MRKVRLNPEINPIGTKHYMTVNGVDYPYVVRYIWGDDTFAAVVEPLVVAEMTKKGEELVQPFMFLPLSVFAEVFQYSDNAFWMPVKQYQDMSEGEAEIVD